MSNEKQALRSEIAATRNALSESVHELAAKADVTERAKDAARTGAGLAKENVQLAADRTTESVRRQPGRWATAVLGAIAAAGALVVLNKRRRR
jgi:hypothetical protein